MGKYDDLPPSQEPQADPEAWEAANVAEAEKNQVPVAIVDRPPDLSTLGGDASADPDHAVGEGEDEPAENTLESHGRSSAVNEPLDPDDSDDEEVSGLANTNEGEEDDV